MKTEAITLDRAKARELYRAYKTHRHYSEPMDDEIRRAYQLLAQGRLIIRAIDSVVKAGLDDDGHPKLALLRADKKEVRFQAWHDGSGYMEAADYPSNRAGSLRFKFPNGSFVKAKGGRALMPTIPVMHRPRRGLANYHVLWEAEWRPIPPRDPFLLRRIGKADMWLVVAMWDLTEVERAALAARIGNA